MPHGLMFVAVFHTTLDCSCFCKRHCLQVCNACKTFFHSSKCNRGLQQSELQKDWESIFQAFFPGCPINHLSKRRMDIALADTVSADIDMLKDHPSTTEGKLSSQLTTRMSLEKARGPSSSAYTLDFRLPLQPVAFCKHYKTSSHL